MNDERRLWQEAVGVGAGAVGIHLVLSGLGFTGFWLGPIAIVVSLSGNEVLWKLRESR
jgi:hypothetical protein